MALIKCPECGREISDRAAFCVGCGISKEDIQDILADRKSKQNEINNVQELKTTETNGNYKNHTILDKMTIENEVVKYPTISPVSVRDKRYIEARLNKHNFNIIYRIGDVIKFGKCEGQDIEWVVLKVEINRVLLLSKYILDLQSYNISKTAITWENCSLRHYMNCTFIEKNFSVEEKRLIVPVTVRNNCSNRYNVSGGEDTTDKVFCLSIDEISEIFTKNVEGRALPTKWCQTKTVSLRALPTKWCQTKAVNQGIGYEFCGHFSGGGCGNWWLRSPGYDSHSAAYVDGEGIINAVGRMVNTDRVGVRPALWMRI